MKLSPGIIFGVSGISIAILAIVYYKKKMNEKQIMEPLRFESIPGPIPDYVLDNSGGRLTSSGQIINDLGSFRPLVANDDPYILKRRNNVIDVITDIIFRLSTAPLNNVTVKRELERYSRINVDSTCETDVIYNLVNTMIFTERPSINYDTFFVMALDAAKAYIKLNKIPAVYDIGMDICP